MRIVLKILDTVVFLGLTQWKGISFVIVFMDVPCITRNMIDGIDSLFHHSPTDTLGEVDVD